MKFLELGLDVFSLDNIKGEKLYVLHDWNITHQTAGQY